MKKYIATILFATFMSFAFGQTETSSYKNIADTFEKNYNADNFDAIFSSFSKEMQSALPLKKTKEFFTGLKTQAGKIIKREFVKYKSTYAIYKTQFNKTIFAVNISVDNDAKINGLLITAFTDENLPKIERNKTKMALPFKDEWIVVWGGDTKELNYHVENNAQKKRFRYFNRRQQRELLQNKWQVKSRFLCFWETTNGTV
jgi:hypothetical protein